MFGVLNINKPYRWTSRDVVNRVQRLVRPARAGHAGTLDPLATGVLLVAIGQATRLIKYAKMLPKAYRATFLLGRRSETEDLESDVELLPDAFEPLEADIRATLAASFTGELMQRPSRHSAIKVAGRRAYDLARGGVDFELPPRPVVIHRIEIVKYRYPELVIDVECGGGTYIRALGRDLAAALGTTAVMASLERTRVGSFAISRAATVEDILLGVEPHIASPAPLAASIASILVTPHEISELNYGRPIEYRDMRITPALQTSELGCDEIAAFDDGGKLVAILTTRKLGALWPVRNFSQPS
jgi:tRNA pseudouridine55 synthase